MAQDPYKVLGISSEATDEEITKAYRKLVKKYHPDLHPGDEEATKKMSEINEAYDRIKSGNVNNSNHSQSSSSYTNYNNYNTQKTYYRGEDLYIVANRLIGIRAYEQALQVLSQISNKTAEWYYLSSVANYRLGNKIIALEHIKIAVQREPNNFVYQKLLQEIQSGGNSYKQRSNEYGKPVDMQNICWWWCILNTVCNCCCGRRIFFC